MFRAKNIVILCGLFVYALYLSFFAAHLVSHNEGKSFFLLADDAMVSMRYAKDLATGHGLVWNIGERVEGISNPLWTVYMAALHFFSDNPSLLVMITSILLLLACGYITGLLVYNYTESTCAAFSSVLLLCAAFPLNLWSLRGFEVGCCSFFLLLAIYLFTIDIKSILQKFTRKNKIDSGGNITAAETRSCIGIPLISLIIIAIGTLLRLDFLIFMVPFFLLAFFSKNRKVVLRTGIWIVIIIAIVMIPQTLFRLWYYGDILPNTFYLKAQGYPLFLRLSRGAIVTLKTFFQYQLIALVPLILFSKYKNGILPKMLIFSIITQFAYSIWAGGDAWEWYDFANRFLATVFPLIIILSVIMFYDFIKMTGDLFPTYRKNMALLAFCGICFCIWSVSLASGGNFRNVRRAMMFEQIPELDTHIYMANTAAYLNESLNDSAKVAVVWAGVLPYFLKPSIHLHDMLGKSNKRIAKMQCRTDLLNARTAYEAFYPGHMKYDYDYSIGEVKPDVIVSFQSFLKSNNNWLNNYERGEVFGIPLFFRKGSSAIKWEILGRYFKFNSM
jgi:hypothetical protein